MRATSYGCVLRLMATSYERLASPPRRGSLAQAHRDSLIDDLPKTYLCVVYLPAFTLATAGRRVRRGAARSRKPTVTDYGATTYDLWLATKHVLLTKCDFT